jgi:hypothetical protein
VPSPQAHCIYLPLFVTIYKSCVALGGHSLGFALITKNKEPTNGNLKLTLTQPAVFLA